MKLDTLIEKLVKLKEEGYGYYEITYFDLNKANTSWEENSSKNFEDFEKFYFPATNLEVFHDENTIGIN